jgi:hypothetical protein
MPRRPTDGYLRVAALTSRVESRVREMRRRRAATRPGIPVVVARIQGPARCPLSRGCVSRETHPLRGRSPEHLGAEYLVSESVSPCLSAPGRLRPASEQRARISSIQSGYAVSASIVKPSGFGSRPGLNGSLLGDLTRAFARPTGAERPPRRRRGSGFRWPRGRVGAMPRVSRWALPIGWSSSRSRGAVYAGAGYGRASHAEPTRDSTIGHQNLDGGLAAARAEPPG